MLLLIVLSLLVNCQAWRDPKLDQRPFTLTVRQNGNAVLPCSAENLGGLRVVWVGPEGTAISVEDRRMIVDQRFSVERPYAADWNLHIRNAQPYDSGQYSCMINSRPVQQKNVTLHVVGSDAFTTLPPVMSSESWVLGEATRVVSACVTLTLILTLTLTLILYPQWM